tara:strand:- start:24440 stop:25234 length:795 start_codon:yes stop_codon:yes gene_type:complete
MISVNKVYQKVLAITNKEQRGYITPREFNLFADQAQMDIFEQYFYDLEQRKRGIGNKSGYADTITSLEEKIAMFEKNEQELSASGQHGDVYVSNNLTDFYRLGSINVGYAIYSLDSEQPLPLGFGDQIAFYKAEPVKISELRKYENSPLGIYTKKRPVYTKFNTPGSELTIRVYPTLSESDVFRINYIRRPKVPNWTYLVSTGANKSALYNPTAPGHQDFELHASEEKKIVLKILQLAGVSIKDLQLTGVITQEEIKGLQQEKQ